MKTCPNCRADNRWENRFCTQCGAKLENTGEFRTRLVLLSGEQNKAIYELSQTENTIGRDLGNNIVVVDEQVSKRHAAIYYDKDRFWITDLESRNGVYVNGLRIEKPTPLMDGSLIKLGSTIFKFQTSVVSWKL